MNEMIKAERNKYVRESKHECCFLAGVVLIVA